MHYRCQYVDDREPSWDNIARLQLSGVVAGEKPRLSTWVQVCWTKDSLWVRFTCEDDHTVATMRGHDEPLYQEDVVEIFLDEEGTGTRYLELEVNPLNTVFDAVIDNDSAGRITIGLSWDAEGLATRVETTAAGERVYELAIPFCNFNHAPSIGTQWRVNFYRIDEDPTGGRHYWAWSPTGEVNFHRPLYFGTLVFVRPQ